MVLAVAHQHEIGVARRELAERAHRLAQRLADRGAAARDAIGRGVLEPLEEQAVVAGQRAEHVGAPGEADQRETMAAVPLHRLRRARGSPPWRAPGGWARRPRPACCRRRRAARSRRGRGAAPRGALAPVRLHQRHDQAGERAAEAERAAPAPPRAGPRQQPRREVGRDERRQRRPLAREGAGVEQQRRRHQRQQPDAGKASKRIEAPPTSRHRAQARRDHADLEQQQGEGRGDHAADRGRRSAAGARRRSAPSRAGRSRHRSRAARPRRSRGNTCRRSAPRSARASPRRS